MTIVKIFLAIAAMLLLAGCGASREERFARAEKAFAAQKWSAAEGDYEKILKDDPKDFYAHLRLAEIYFEKKRYDIMIGYHLREAERIMKDNKDERMRDEFRRVRGKIIGKALEGGHI